MAIQSRIIDIHSHILPGIDDGAKTIFDSLAIIQELASQGITDIIATPHYINESIFMSDSKKNKKLADELNKQLKNENIDVSVYLGNEIYISNNIPELINNSKISTLAGGRYLLVELPLDEEFPNYEDYLLELMNQDYKVILAHPERYTLAQDDESMLDNLYEMGVLLQCNFGSINGKYGKDAQKLAKRLAKNHMIFAFGSDIHHPNKKDFINQARKKLSKYYTAKELEELFVENPLKILSSR